MQKRGLAVVTVAATAALITSVTAAGTATATPSPKAIPHTHPAWTAHARHLGHAANSAKVHARVYLAPRGGLAAVRGFAHSVSTPGNAHYGQYLTPALYNARFAPTADTATRVSHYLRAHGLHVTGVGANHRYLSVRGSAKAAEKAFGTSIDRYRHHGRVVQAPARTLRVPASLGSSVLTVTGLDTTPKRNAPTRVGRDKPTPGYRNARPCSIYYGQIKAKYQADYHTPLPKFHGQRLAYAPCGYTGPQFRAAYEGGTQLDGSGITVAITDAYASPTIKKDANTYAERNGDGSYAPGQLVQTKAATFTNRKQCGPSGWYGEETLDVEAVHAMAPGARIHYYGAASCYDSDFLDTLAQVVQDGDAQLVSNSWGDVEENESADAIAAYESVFLQGASEGISFMFSSGDNGDELQNTALKQADYPTSDPYVTSVGGTSTGIGADGSLSFQTGWGTTKFTLAPNGKHWKPAGFLYGAGGGASALFNRPSYQDGVNSSPYRTVPDVAMDADPTTGMLVGQTQQFPEGNHYGEYRIGGTSLASPLFAGMTALTLQSRHMTTGAGLLNEAIYANRSDFNDVLPRHQAGAPKGAVRVDFANGLDASGGLLYSVRTFDHDSSLQTTKGYDEVTGIGVPGTGWLTALGK